MCPDIKVFPLSGGPISPHPELDSASISLSRGDREKKGREAFENVSCSISSLLAARCLAFTVLAEPNNSPVVHCLATRQLFPLL